MATPELGSVHDGYRFKGGDPNQESSWEQVAPIDVSAQYGAGARQLPNGVIERVGPRGGVQRIGAANGGAGGGSQSSALVGADARARFMTGLQPLIAAQNDLRDLERGGNPVDRDWGANLIDTATNVPFLEKAGDALARRVGGEDYQRYTQARSTYESSLLPILSGAAVTPSEAARLSRADLPQPGDTPAVLAQKARNRAQRINAIAQGIGEDQPFAVEDYQQPPPAVIEDRGAGALPSYPGVTDLTGGVSEIAPQTPYGPQPGDVVTTSQPLAAEDTPESLRAQGYEYDPAADTWRRTTRVELTPQGAVADRSDDNTWWRRLDGFVRGVADTATFGLADEIAAGGDALIGRGNGRDFSERYQNNLQTQRAIDRADAQAIPVSRTSGQVAGAFAAPGAVASGRWIGNAPNAGYAVTRGATVGAGYGAAYGAGSADMDRAQGAISGGVSGGLTGGALSGAGRAIGGVLGRSGNPRPPSDPDVLAQSGVFVTPGAQRGGLAKSIEDLSQRAPIMGPAVRGARQRSVESLNRGVANRVLSNIGEGLPANIKPGADSVDYVARRLGKEFDRAADLVTEASPDQPFLQGVARISQGVTDLAESEATRFQNILRDRLSRLSGPVSGKQLRKIESEFGTLATQVDDPLLRSMLFDVQGELQSLLARSSPEAADILSRARPAYREFTILRQASQASGGNVFTPSQLMTAVRGQDSSVGNGMTARGLSPLQDLARAARNVIPDNYGNPGTADALGYGALAGGAVANPLGAAGAAAALGAAATPYMVMGRKIVESIPANATPEQKQNAIRQLATLARRDPNVEQLITSLLNTGQVAAPVAIAASQ